MSITTVPPLYPLPDWYVQPEQQIERVKGFLKAYGGDNGFTSADIPPIPTNFVSRTPTEVLMLMVYLPDSASVNSTRRTFESWWNCIIPPSGSVKRRRAQLRSDDSHLQLLPCIEHQPGIRWVGFDSNANQGMSPQSCWNNPDVASELASAEILAAVALFPGWRTTKGSESPFPNIAGYQFYAEGSWDNCLFLGLSDADILLDLDACPLDLDTGTADEAWCDWACPSVREC